MKMKLRFSPRSKWGRPLESGGKAKIKESLEEKQIEELPRSKKGKKNLFLQIPKRRPTS